MSESYVELLVARKPNFAMRFLRMLLIMLTVAFVLILIILPGVVGLFLAVLAGVGAYFANMYASIEYEYLYVDKEISVDKVLAKSKRRRRAVTH